MDFQAWSVQLRVLRLEPVLIVKQNQFANLVAVANFVMAANWAFRINLIRDSHLPKPSCEMSLILFSALNSGPTEGNRSLCEVGTWLGELGCDWGVVGLTWEKVGVRWGWRGEVQGAWGCGGGVGKG